MFLDAYQRFSDAQAVTTTAVSTNIVDLGGDRNIGVGEPMAVVVVLDVGTDFTTGDETYVVTLETDDNSSFSSAAVIATKAIIGLNAAGSKFVLGVPADSSCERYLRLNYTQGGTTPTATYTSFLIPQSMIQNEFVYPDGFTIS